MNAKSSSGSSLSAADGQAQALFARAVAMYQAGEHAAAAAELEQLLARDGRHVEALGFLGLLRLQSGHIDAALRLIESSLSLHPQQPVLCMNTANGLHTAGRSAAALAWYGRAIAQQPDLSLAYYNRGQVLHELSRPAEALADYEQAIRLQPDLYPAHYSRGNCLRALRRPRLALQSYATAIALRPAAAEAHNNRANVLLDMNRVAAARDAYARAMALNPGLPYLPGSLLHSKLRCCDWSRLDTQYAHLFAAIDRGETAAVPFYLLSMPATAAQQQRCAQIYTQDRYAASSGEPYRFKPMAHERIRLGYFSSDLREHAMGYLIAELIERLDRSRFEVIAFSLSPARPSPIRARLERAFDVFIDAAALSDAALIAKARALELDIAIDLNGHTSQARTRVFAARVAPLQVSHMGYPGTLGADFMDYIVADKVVIPAGSAGLYNERIVYLPDTYWFNDSTKRIADRPQRRSEHGLPETGFVFCAFTNAYKISPDVFAIWMDLLHAIDGAVLWLLEGGDVVEKNLRAHAQRHGIAPQRLIFAPRLELTAHLARHRCADLFLDTFHYNGHTTVSDALWAGLPVLTRCGASFAARVAASQLTALDLAELITHRAEDYT